jgi:hypothetical protein
MTVSERPLGRGLAVALLFLNATALAQPSAAQRETARALMADARRLRERGDLNGALGRFSAADAIMNVPTTALEVAATQAELGKLVEARESLLRLLAAPPGPGDPEPFSEARAKALALSQQLVARIGSIVVTASDVSEADGLELRLDGEIVRKEVVGLPLRVNPGTHQIAARLQGREFWRELDVAEGQVIEVPLRFTGAPPSVVTDDHRSPPPPTTLEQPGPRVAATRPPSPASTASTSGPQGTTSQLFYVGAAVGTLGVALGAVGGVSAILHRNSAARGCTNNVCPSVTWRDLQTAHNMATVSNVGFVIGGAGWAFAIGALLFERPRPAQRGWRVAPEVSRQGASVNVAGRF